MNKRKERVKDLRRLGIVILAVMLFWTVLVFRLVHIQIINKGKYVDMANHQYVQEEKLETSRGIIYDRNLTCMAINQPILSIGMDLTLLTDPNLAAEKLSKILGKNYQTLLQSFTRNKNFVWVAREVKQELANRILVENIPGIHLIKESRRVYPNKHIASQLIGFTDVDERGLSGIEYAFDEELKGRSGKIFRQKDAFGVKLANVNYGMQAPEAGKDVALTIDCTYQSIVQEELRHSIREYGADGGIVVMLKPKTGEVLAMACEPGFDLNLARHSAEGLWRNRAITDVFEPGSTFKIVLMSAILQERIMSLNDTVFCENGRYEILKEVIRDHKGYGDLPLGDVLVYSSNIGMGKISKKIEPNVFYKYARNFGFGNLTNIRLGGEITGELKHPVHWSEFTSIAMGYGYEVAVTPIQLAMAYAAIANGGKLLEPQIVKTIGENLKETGSVEPIVVRQILTPGTAKMMRDLLEQVVDRGTGKKARINDLRICGKTGTAHKWDVATRSYSTNDYLSSFVGFYPADDPEILICTMIDNPRTTYWGGEVATPTFKRIVQRLINLDDRFMFRRVEDKPEEQKKAPKKIFTSLPDFTNRRFEQTQQLLEQLGIKSQTVNNGHVIASQKPAPGTPLAKDMQVNFSLFRLGEQDSTDFEIAPKLVGLSMREAVNRLALANLKADIQGNGRVVRQSPKPGQRMKPGESCLLECQTRFQPEKIAVW